MKTTIVVPCYNEATRLDSALTKDLAADVSLLFVDDGSTDGTATVIESAVTGTRHQLLKLTENRGKAEAVRAGLLAAIESQPECVGYWDADGATPFSVINEFSALMESHRELHLLMGSRVRMLGRRIDRRTTRHYGGRVIATAISLILGLPVYDTQCGAKILRVTPALQRALAEPFHSRWLFDVELIARLRRENRWSSGTAEDHIHEFPLHQWRDVGDSRIRAPDLLRLPFDLLRLYRHYH